MHGGGHQADERLLLLIHTENLVEFFGRNDCLHAPGRILADAFLESLQALLHSDFQLAHLRLVCSNGLLQIRQVEDIGLECLSGLDDGVNTSTSLAGSNAQRGQLTPQLSSSSPRAWTGPSTGGARLRPRCT